MESVVIERLFETPADADALRSAVAAGRWCFELYGVDYARGYLAPDGGRMICLFEARDTESVRMVNDTGGLAYVDAWPGTVHGPGTLPEPDAAVVVVERRFAEPVAFDEIQAREEAGAWCLEQHAVRFVETWFSRDRRRMLCVYTAPDAESVRASQSTIDMPFERVWPATRFRPP